MVGLSKYRKTGTFSKLVNEGTSIAMVRKADAKYIGGGTWRCEASPTGAHHWIRVTYDKTVDGLWHCKWCNDFRIM